MYFIVYLAYLCYIYCLFADYLFTVCLLINLLPIIHLLIVYVCVFIYCLFSYFLLLVYSLFNY